MEASLKEEPLPVALTSQEKKVLGFIAVMVVLGFIMLGVKKLQAPNPGASDLPASSASQTLH
jgi:hypothetical protein